MNLFVSGVDAMTMAAASYAEHLAAQHGLACVRRSQRTGVIDLAALAPGTRRQLVSVAMTAAENLRFDVAVLANDCTWQRFKVLASDMDSTLITIECIDEIAEFCGKKAEVAAITEAAMRGEITDFADSLKRRVALLEGTPVATLARVYEERLKLSPGAKELLEAARRHALKTLLVSGGFDYFTERLKEQLDLDSARSNHLGMRGEKLTGLVEGTILDGEGKRAALSKFCELQGVSAQQAIAIGDGANDLAMMSIAGLSVAYHAKAAVCASATVSIRFGGLDLLDDWLEPTGAQRESAR